jgi:hypothetical protein
MHPPQAQIALHGTNYHVVFRNLWGNIGGCCRFKVEARRRGLGFCAFMVFLNQNDVIGEQGQYCVRNLETRWR